MSRHFAVGCLAGLTVFLFATPGIAADSTSTYVLEWRMGFQSGSTHIATTIPFELRAVPVHPDDGFSGPGPATDPLPNRRLSIPRRSSYGFALSVMPRTHYYGIRIVSQGILGDNYGMYEQNQGGTSERGYGMSLRYYKVTAVSDNGLWSIAPFIETPWYGATKSTSVRFVGSVLVGLTGYPVTVDGGWDRYNAFETWRSRQCGVIYEDHLALELDVGVPIQKLDRGGVIMGYIFVQIVQPRYRYRAKVPDLGIELHHRPTWQIGFGVG